MPTAGGTLNDPNRINELKCTINSNNNTHSTISVEAFEQQGTTLKQYPIPNVLHSLVPRIFDDSNFIIIFHSYSVFYFDFYIFQFLNSVVFLFQLNLKYNHKMYNV